MEPPNQQQVCLDEQISKVFVQTYSLLLFYTPALDINKAISMSLQKSFESKTDLILLLDFDDFEIDRINSFLQDNHRNKIIQKKNYSALSNNIYGVMKIGSYVKEKRKIIYENGGVYSITSMVLILDLISELLRPQKVTKLIVNLTERISDHFRTLPWIATLLKIGRSQSSIIVCCKKPFLYSNQQSLESLYRYFFCKKIVIWPFGRSQIHKAINNIPIFNKFQEIHHKLTLSSLEKQVHFCLLQLLRFLQKTHNNSHPQRQLDALNLISSGRKCYQRSYDGFQNQINQFLTIKFIIQALLNLSPMNFLCLLQQIIVNSNPNSLWKSNNSRIEQLLKKIMKKSKERVFQFKYILDKQMHTNIDITNLGEDQLSRKSKSTVQQKQDQQKQSQKLSKQQYCSQNSQCFGEKTVKGQTKLPYKLIYNANIFEKSAAKFTQLLQILNSIEKQYKQILTEDVMKQGYERVQVYIYVPNQNALKNLHHSLFQHQHNYTYLEHLRSLYYYLEVDRINRVRYLKRIKNRLEKAINSTSSMPNKRNMKEVQDENQCILFEAIHHQLRQLFEIYKFYEEKFVVPIYRQFQPEQSMEVHKLFEKELEARSFRYIDKAKLKLPPSYNPTQKIYFGKCLQLYFTKSQNISEFNETFKYMMPMHCIFYTPNTLLLRNLYIQASQKKISLKKVFALSFKQSLQQEIVTRQITVEDEAFWNISQARARIPDIVESAQLRVKQLKIDDEITKKCEKLSRLSSDQKNEVQKVTQKINISQIISNTQIKLIQPIHINSQRRKIIIDKRQFKSALPSYLFHYGFEVVPIFLDVADYIISDDIAIQKKSVHTRDLHESLRTGRLDQQLKQMQKKFLKPYLLIECNDIETFSKQNFTYSLNNMTGQRYIVNVRKQLMQLLAKYRKIRVIWSTELIKTCEIFKKLKMNQLQPDIKKFMPKQQKQEELVPKVKKRKQSQTTLLQHLSNKPKLPFTSISENQIIQQSQSIIEQ